MQNYAKPCKTMENVRWEYIEDTFLQTTNESDFREFWFSFGFPLHAFKEISQTRALDINSLIGNIGGYVGLLLGVSILQISHLLLQFCVNIDKLYKRRITKRRKETDVTNFLNKVVCDITQI
jgi:hypothetical protein